MQLSQNIRNDEKLIVVLRNGGIAVIPTDTIYGIVGMALDKSVVLHIYKIRKRASDKPCIILISDIKELVKFSIHLSEEQKNKLEEYWPVQSGVKGSSPTSIILDCLEEKFSYLHRGTNTLAFRVPAQEDLRSLLKKTGPLLAPSANVEGLPPAQNIEEAQGYFGNSVNLYADGGEITGRASKVIKLHKDSSISILRE